jgi:predicted DNA-binding transcriptional regulator YafY
VLRHRSDNALLPFIDMPRVKEEWSKAKRLFHIAELLRGQPCTVARLQTSLGDEVSKRDVQRDLATLQELIGEPFERLPKRPPEYVIRTQQNSLHPIETLLLHAATRLVYHRSDGHGNVHRATLKKLEAWLPETVRDVVHRSTADLGNQRRNTMESRNLEHVSSAWLNGHRLKFLYQSANGSGTWRSNLLEVYFVEAHPSNLALYAVGLETGFHNAVRTFKLSRMKELVVLRDTTYTIPENFDPTAFFQNAWGVIGQSDGAVVEIELRFAPEATRRLEEGGYPNMTVTALPDGSRFVTFKAGTDKTGLPLEVLAWVHTWGARVEVLKPAALRTRWLEDCQAVVERYGKK